MLQAQQLLQKRYQLKQQLGQHPGRQTWLAEDTQAFPTELVVVKILAFYPQMQWDDVKLFEREAQVLKQLNHPRIPCYRDYFSLDWQTGASELYWFGLVQNYIPGASLRQLLNQGKRFSETQVRKIATDVLEILLYLHRLNPPVLHRDIKPSNLILGDDGQIYLVDFGSVQNSAATEGVTFTVVGTMGYAPLEQFWGRTVPASDLYALGATLIHLLTGTAPADLPQQDLRIQFSDRISLDPRFTRWIEVLTEPDLEQRFTQASEALEALRSNRYPKISKLALSQPAGSRVQLKKSTKQLSIVIPKQKRSLLEIIKLGGNFILSICSFPLLLLLGFAILALAIALLFVLLHNIVLFLVVLPLTVLLAWLWVATTKELDTVQHEVNRALRHLFGYYCISFDRDYFVIERQLFGLNYLRQIGQISDIKNINKIPFKKLVIQAKMMNYSLAEDLTEPEREWLCQEIQDWLNFRD